MWGLESISGDALVIRLVIKTRANAKDDVARELRMRLKHSIDELGIPLPSLTTIMPSGIEGAQRVRGANPPKTKPTAVTPRRTGTARVATQARRTEDAARRSARRADDRDAGNDAMTDIPGAAPLSFYDEVGGHATFVRLVDTFYRGVAEDEVLRPMYPEEDLGPAKERLTMFLEQYWGGPDHLQPGARASPPANAPRLVPRQPRRARSLARPHARGGRRTRTAAAARGDAVGLPPARRARDGEHLRADGHRTRHRRPRRARHESHRRAPRQRRHRA